MRILILLRTKLVGKNGVV